ncbi:BQ5605_C086g13018 [Microbotryum silenes-dioicae]|uniref:BQ5605_C086g13018 protein n=1 Tax=Microbotryum silenes-dioicae TaxID=796604 RepID=A0A2X0MS93_9BASI|nr:BQ5605_C086g13018 [Microbotryum silenes-dioicae]
MVRFHLFGLVAVALAIQAPPLALAIQGPPAFGPLDSRCRNQADKVQPTYSPPSWGTCPSLAKQSPGGVSHDVYMRRCQCGGRDWWEKYRKCLDAHLNSWSKDILKDKAKRCQDCKTAYKNNDMYPDSSAPFRICQAWRAGVS